ncbi:PREDICTED: uncharacterized protein LOC109581689 [Amphimedon queenslandica]|uniref:Uncharacterized protein n=1 Tax=Amphimedon queenslandica TaxID=400682 RepID=A0AAN0J4C2_AMPQE|nr:PREDICTED: uncharacterized protein LOC109581689 [Amphimedon queenslandica]|eukprot:XP_019851563.1 PREDICTED: uncharacterized protein LOC109581689 [Amphimedon queenslandica]
MEIPGYYYDELLRRYFKIPPAEEREMYRMGNEKEKEKEERKKVIKKEHGITDTVSLLRDRACSASVDTLKIHCQLFEGMVRQLTQVGHLITSSGHNRAALLPARPIGGITESIKFNESRQVLSVMTEYASKWDLNNLYFTSANGECNFQLCSFKTRYSRPAHFDNSWDFYERAMVTKSFISRFDCPNPPIILFDWDTKKVSSVSWDRHSSTDNPPIALLGYEEGTFKRIDVHCKNLSNDKLFTSNASVNDIVSFSKSMVTSLTAYGNRAGHHSPSPVVLTIKLRGVVIKIR